jgi:2-phospho-L-lactate guanylyltransferase (CobY/MobA/RfbA family)
MSCIPSRAMNIAYTRANMSRDRALVMFFYMRLRKHLCNAMLHDLLLALAVVSFDHLTT